jgi:hypothetical protein
VSTPEPSYEELAALVVELAAQLERANGRIEALEAEVAALRARLGKDSTNSSTPPSADSLAARGKRKADRSQRERSKQRKRGGQPGRNGSGLSPTPDPDRTEPVAALQQCTGCGDQLADDDQVGFTWGQVWDVLPVVWEKVHYVLPKRRCSCCRRLNTPAPPFGQAGAVVYGPNLNAAAILLGSQGNVPVEATTQLMDALLGAPVSTGFVARAQQRLADLLDGAGYDEAMKQALRAEPVLGADESPVNVVDNLDSDAAPATGAAHVVTVRTPDQRLVWYQAVTSRSSQSIKNLGIFDRWYGVLVRDDYAGYHQFDAQLAGVQQCVQHLLRHLTGVAELDADNKLWADQVAAALRDAGKLVGKAKATDSPLDADALADARWRYDQGVLVGISFNLSRPWPKGNHPGLVLARRLQAKADQVWLFTKDLRVPWTNNACEQSIRGPKRHQNSSGYWQTTLTLAAYCRIRSYLVSARNHGLHAIDAIHAALSGQPWLPNPTIA